MKLTLKRDLPLLLAALLVIWGLWYARPIGVDTLYPELPTAPADVLILPMTEDLSPAIALATSLRDAGIRTQLHCEEKKFKAKMSYADKLSIPYVIFLGEDEINAGVVACKDMKSGEQTKLNTQETIDRIKAGLAELEKGSVIVE